MKRIAIVLSALILAASLAFAVDSELVVRDGVAKRSKMMLGSCADSWTSVVISSGEITVYESFVVVDTEGDAATDTLSTINAGSAVGKYDQVRDGDFVVMRDELASQDVTIDETGNIELGAYSSITLDTLNDLAIFQYDSGLSKWKLVSFVDDDGIIGITTITATTGNITNYNKMLNLTTATTTAAATVSTGSIYIPIKVDGVQYNLLAN